MGSTYSHNGEDSSALDFLTDNPILRKHSIRRRSRTYEDNIEFYLKEIGVNTISWYDSAENIEF